MIWRWSLEIRCTSSSDLKEPTSPHLNNTRPPETTAVSCHRLQALDVLTSRRVSCPNSTVESAVSISLLNVTCDLWIRKLDDKSWQMLMLIVEQCPWQVQLSTRESRHPEISRKFAHLSIRPLQSTVQTNSLSCHFRSPIQGTQ